MNGTFWRVARLLIGFGALAALLPGGCGGSTMIVSSNDAAADVSSAGGAGPDTGGAGGGIATGAPSATPCASDKDCTASRQLCDTSRKLCVGCRFDVDCSPGAVCSGGVCQPFISCINSRDCPTNQVCDATKWRCVDCVANTDCQSASVCVASLCRLKCASDKDCASTGQLCDKTKGYCAECLKDADCPVSSYCDSGKCSAKVCTPQSSLCLRTALFTCDSHGAGYSSVDCSNGCSETGGAHCVVGGGAGGTGGSSGSSGTAGGGGTGGSSATGGMGGATGGSGATGGTTGGAGGATGGSGGATGGTGGTGGSACPGTGGAPDTVTVPDCGTPGAPTQNAYTGLVTITVSGIIQGAAGVFSDAFYTLDASDMTKAITACSACMVYNRVSEGSCVCPAECTSTSHFVANLLTAGYPAFNPSHIYTVQLDLGAISPEQLNFAYGDCGCNDNAGSYSLTIACSP